MAEILKIGLGEEPSSYTNHVLIEETPAGLFRATGACNRDGNPAYLSTPQTRELGAILKQASSWADAHGIHFVHVRMAEAPGVRHTEKRSRRS